MDAMAIMKLGYDQYCGMVELSHFMPLSLAIMSIFARLYLICTRVAVICATLYNRIFESSQWNEVCEGGTCSEEWDRLTGTFQQSLVVPDEVTWPDTLLSTIKDGNQVEIDKLSREIENSKQNGDDLGEEVDVTELEQEEDATRTISDHLVYKPSTPSNHRKTPLSTPQTTETKLPNRDTSIRASAAPSSPSSPKQNSGKPEQKRLTKEQPIAPHEEKGKEKLGHKHRHEKEHKHHHQHLTKDLSTKNEHRQQEVLKEMTKKEEGGSRRPSSDEVKKTASRASECKPSFDIDSLFSLHVKSDDSKMKKDKKKDKLREVEAGSDGAMKKAKAKKRPSEDSPSDEIDDLFGLLSPIPKKHKHI